VSYASTDVRDDREARYLQTVSALGEARARLHGQVIPAVTGVFTALRSTPWLIPWRDTITDTWLKTEARLEGADGIIDKLLSVATLPPALWRVAMGWTGVRAELSHVVGDLGVTNREIHVFWQGTAAGTYERVLPAHVSAAAQLGGVADTIQYAADWAGSAGATLYTAVLAAVVEGLGSILSAAAAAIAVPFVPIAAAVFLLMAAGDMFDRLAALMATAVDTFSRMLTWGNEMLSEMRDTSAFPNGVWPEAHADWLRNATVADGTAEWSVVA
jgi:hypothetical protein